jgi:hypothetical protein
MDVELPAQVVAELTELLSPSPKGPIEEVTQVKKLTGNIMLRGFSPEAVRSVGDSLRFHVRALKTGTNVRLIIDLDLGTGQGLG